ncbi:MAG: VOC family protein [Alphaproteobacteria bacterium]|nr:VOC family protein [Alphaproteobacteria bacterium]MCB9695216.1 VOC family protein [Alphaproteobacteria bacterium]
MELGAFSVSLAVKDLARSRAFYEALGFVATGGAAEQGWLILANGTTVIGLFQGMFDKNLLTFNPGWRQDTTEVDPFLDVREIERRLVDAGIEIQRSNTAESASGPAHLTLVDPDGNPVLIDQHR